MQQITDMVGINELQYKKKPIVLEFFTQWCPPCKMANKIIETEIVSNPNTFTLGRVNTDEAEELVLDFKIQGVPTIILLKSDLSVSEKIVGLDQNRIKSMLKKLKKEN